MFLNHQLVVQLYSQSPLKLSWNWSLWFLLTVFRFSPIIRKSMFLKRSITASKIGGSFNLVLKLAKIAGVFSFVCELVFPLLILMYTSSSDHHKMTQNGVIYQNSKVSTLEILPGMKYTFISKGTIENVTSGSI